MSRELTLSIYTELGWIALGIGLAGTVADAVVKRWMHLDTLRDEPAPGSRMARIVRARLELQEPEICQPRHRLRAVSCTELPASVVEVETHGRLGDAEQVGDFLVSPAVSHEGEAIALAVA